jgi:hypothetical protein
MAVTDTDAADLVLVGTARELLESQHRKVVRQHDQEVMYWPSVAGSSRLVINALINRCGWMKAR